MVAHVRGIGVALILSVIATVVAGCGQRSTDAAQGGSGLVVPEQAESDKLNAYVAAYNKLLQWHQFNKILSAYRQENPDIADAGRELEDYSLSGSDLDDDIKAFDEAMALEAKLPELDAKAKALRDVLARLNPIYKQALAYSSSKEYLSDGGKKARELDGPLVAGLQAADEAVDIFDAALSAETLRRDEKRLGGLEAGSVAYQKLKASLALRALNDALGSALQDKTRIPTFAAAIQALAEANAELGTLEEDPAAPPAWDPVCKLYKDDIDTLLGLSREVLKGLESGDAGAVQDKLPGFSRASNDAVDASNMCG